MIIRWKEGRKQSCVLSGSNVNAKQKRPIKMTLSLTRHDGNCLSPHALPHSPAHVWPGLPLTSCATR